MRCMILWYHGRTSVLVFSVMSTSGCVGFASTLVMGSYWFRGVSLPSEPKPQLRTIWMLSGPQVDDVWK